MAENRYLTREEAEALARRALAFSRADEARVNIDSGMQGNTRFAVNQVSTAGDTFDATLQVTSAFGRRVASATTNRFDDESLRQVVETSERLARLVPEDPEHMGELEAQPYMDVQDQIMLFHYMRFGAGVAVVLGAVLFIFATLVPRREIISAGSRSGR
jgi:predicted Zn-dependent protease